MASVRSFQFFPWGWGAIAVVLGAATCLAPDTETSSKAQTEKAIDLALAPPVAARGAPLAARDTARSRFGDLRRAFPQLGSRAIPAATFEAMGSGAGAVARFVVPAEAEVARGAVATAVPLSARGSIVVEDPRANVGVAFRMLDARDAALEVGDGVGVYARALGDADVFVVPRASAAEDLVRFPTAPAKAEVRYEVDVTRVAGVRLARRTVEFLDALGVPRLRMNPPYVIGADGAKVDADVRVTGCAVDEGRTPTWRRAFTPHGATRCVVTVAWGEVKYPAVLDPVWENSTTQMTGRRNNTATLLDTGDVLVAGGYDPVTGAAIDSAELFCPPEKCGVTGIFGQTLASPLLQPRGGHTATLLDASHVLIVGGKSNASAAGAIATAEIYDSATASFTLSTSSPSAARAEHTATRLPDGRVLVVGGVHDATAEIYDPANGGFQTPVLNLNDTRQGATASLVGTAGKVLVAGGIGGFGFAVSSAEIFDPATNTFAPLDMNMTSVRAYAAATQLEDAAKSVIITGGTNGAATPVFFSTAEIFDPTPVGTHVNGTFKSQLIQMKSKRAFHTATALTDQGLVLLTGGSDGTANSRLASTEVYDVLGPPTTKLDSSLIAPRRDHVATLLTNGQVVVTGGDDPAAASHFAEVLQRNNGDPCNSAGECASTVCSAKEGVCCDRDCNGVCDECLHVGGVDNGTCKPVPLNQTTLKNCKNDIAFTLVCDGDGGVTAGDINPCTAYACKGLVCRTDDDGCSNDNDCSAKNGWCDFTNRKPRFVDAGADGGEIDAGSVIFPVCKEKQPFGGPTCTAKNQCQTGNCVDGHCCDTECGDQCAACDVPEHPGICSQVVGAPHAGRNPCDSTGTKCEGKCGGNTAKCDYPDNSCGNATCADGRVTGGVCGDVDGVWQCTDSNKECGDYACQDPDAGTDCRTRCDVTATDCAMGRVCNKDHHCIVVHAAVCENDDETLVDPAGTTIDCAPFKCSTDHCLDRCASIDDCIAPAVCDTSGSCVAAPSVSPLPGGCSTSGGSGGETRYGWLALAAIGLALARRRRMVSAALAVACAAQGVFIASASAQPAPGKQTGGALGQPAPDPEAKTEADPAKKEEARTHFTRGLELLKQEAYQAALAEFLRSRELYPTRSATVNAAVVLRKLARFDEALDMFEASLRDFSGWTPADKQGALKAVAELRELVGTIDVGNSVPGATIVVDGKNRAEYPVVEPLRVGAGSHTVRIFKVGFAPFEQRVEVAGGQTVRVVAPLKALAASGRLRVSEVSGKKLEVLVDGALVGVAPWEGVISTGHHAVVLRGDEDWGTAPAAAKVKTNEITSLNLAAVRLEAAVVLSVEPSGAEITIDGVVVGNGIWEGRLARGQHRIEAKTEGFFPKAEVLSLDRGDLKKLTIHLEQDTDAVKWRKPSHVKVDAFGGFAFAPGLGGAASCDTCSAGLATGGFASLHGTYEFGSGLGVGVGVGYVRLAQSVSGRAGTIQPFGLAADDGTTRDALRLHGVLVGATVSYARDVATRFPLMLRLGAGGLIGSMRDIRSGTFTTRDGSQINASQVQNDASAVYIYVDPEVTLGLHVTENVEIDAGFQGLLLIAAKRPKWGDDGDPALSIGKDGFSTYPKDPIAGGFIAAMIPELGVRITF